MKVEDVAKICHQANKALCESMNDYSQSDWEFAPEWQKTSAINGVQFHLRNPNAFACCSHEQWMKEKLENGWKYGPIKDVEKKEHPCIVDFDKLPLGQQLKDLLFKSIVDELSSFVDEE